MRHERVTSLFGPERFFLKVQGSPKEIRRVERFIQNEPAMKQNDDDIQELLKQADERASDIAGIIYDQPSYRERAVKDKRIYQSDLENALAAQERRLREVQADVDRRISTQNGKLGREMDRINEIAHKVETDLGSWQALEREVRTFQGNLSRMSHDLGILSAEFAKDRDFTSHNRDNLAKRLDKLKADMRRQGKNLGKLMMDHQPPKTGQHFDVITQGSARADRRYHTDDVLDQGRRGADRRTRNQGRRRIYGRRKEDGDWIPGHSSRPLPYDG